MGGAPLETGTRRHGCTATLDEKVTRSNPMPQPQVFQQRESHSHYREVAVVKHPAVVDGSMFRYASHVGDPHAVEEHAIAPILAQRHCKLWGSADSAVRERAQSFCVKARTGRPAGQSIAQYVHRPGTPTRVPTGFIRSHGTGTGGWLAAEVFGPISCRVRNAGIPIASCIADEEPAARRFGWETARKDLRAADNLNGRDQRPNGFWGVRVTVGISDRLLASRRRHYR